MELNIAIVAANTETISSFQDILQHEEGLRASVVQPEPDIAIRSVRDADILLLDYNLPQDTVFYFLRALLELPGKTRPVLINAPDDPSHLVCYLERGIVGYVLANEPDERVIDIVSGVLQDGACIKPDAIHPLIERFRELRQRSRMSNQIRASAAWRDSDH